MKILLWANGGSSKTRYWGPGTNSFKLYSHNKDKSIKITQVHGIKDLKVDLDVFESEVFLSDFQNKSLLARIKFIIKANKWVRSNYKKYDVFHGLGAFETTFTAAYQFAKLGKPAFIHLTGDQTAFLNNSKISKLLGVPQRRIKRANDITGYIANSKAMVQMLKNVGVRDEKIFNISNHADTTKFHPVNEEEKKSLRKQLNIPERFTVVLIGGLCYRKRTFELTQACGNLIKQGATLNLVLVGPDREGGEMKKKITSYKEENNLEDYIHLIDYTPMPIKYYQASDLFVLASKHEGMSGALIEAMATGLPSIVTKISGSEDLIISGENGLYTDGSVEDIQAKISQFYNDKEFTTKTGRNARNFIEENCSTEIVLKKHLDLFKKFI